MEIERIEDWIGRSVLDVRGQRLGKLKEVFYDASSGAAVLISVRNGRIGGKTRLIPLQGAMVTRGHVRVSYDKEHVQGTEERSGEQPVGHDELNSVAVVYGMDFSGTAEVRTAREWAAHREELDAARANAQQLRQEAEEKLAQSRAARQRADAANADAEAAEAEAEQAQNAAHEAIQAVSQLQ